MIKEYLRNYIIRSATIGIFSLIGNYSQNPASDTTGNKFYNSIILKKINEKSLEEITKKDLLFYSERDKTEYRIGQNLNFYNNLHFSNKK